MSCKSILRTWLWGLLALLLCSSAASANTPGVCTGPLPTCDATNTCGSAKYGCTVSVAKIPGSVDVKPLINGIPTDTTNIICVDQNTKMTWVTATPNSFFNVRFSTPSPFENKTSLQGDNINTPRAIAAHEGCYVFAVTVCDASGSSCAHTDPKVVVGGTGIEAKQSVTNPRNKAVKPQPQH